ncbi:hypothetical protein [Sphingosinicella sp. BN140058]|uniref:hypothetical protein n=1 Tax=Sphingosinicella sp. BN140058 TaxID=1892855 RepID=UPI0010131B62|nr:hypothetical protein [Sphingosinicella sp. BN140058]QAY77421.1 hypothetical protein ETR14_13580 [Sphingosinicella sp. BN140058]
MRHNAVADAPGVTVHVVGRLSAHKGLAPRGVLSCREPGGCELSLVSKRKGLFAVIVRTAAGEEHMLPIPSWRPVPEERLMHLSIGIGVLARRLALVRLNVDGSTLVETALAVAIDPRADWRERLGRAGGGRAAASDFDVREVRRVEMFLGSAWERRLSDAYAAKWNLASDDGGEAAPPFARLSVSSDRPAPVGWSGSEPLRDRCFGLSPIWESA